MPSRLSSLLASGEASAVLEYFAALSVAARRRGHEELARGLSALPSERLWPLVGGLVSAEPRAFLGTCLKSVAPRFGRDLRLDDAACLQFVGGLRGVDADKTLLSLLPVLSSPEDVVLLLRVMGVEEPRRRVSFLLRVATPPCLFTLLHTLHYVDDDRPLLVRTAAFLMKSGLPGTFNMAALLRAVFDLHELRGTFSLRLRPYELSRLHESYEAFCAVLH